MTEPNSLEELRAHLRRFRERRQALQGQRARRPHRVLLTRQERSIVLAKTAGRCHICGGMIEGAWQADHVLAHSAGGKHHADNYLPAHALCNNYRWDYLAEEFQLILKLGVWVRTRIERDEKSGRDVGVAFIEYERRRRARRRPSAKPDA